MKNEIDIGGRWKVTEFLYENKDLLWRDFTRILRRDKKDMKVVTDKCLDEILEFCKSKLNYPGNADVMIARIVLRELDRVIPEGCKVCRPCNALESEGWEPV